VRAHGVRLRAGRVTWTFDCFPPEDAPPRNAGPREAHGPGGPPGVESQQALAAQKALRLENALTNVVVDVECDRGRILQVFGNLIGNAIKFTPRGGAVAVRAKQHGEEMMFSVADTGPGMGADEVAHVFDRYWEAKKTARLGTGLGLSIAEGLVKAHGGQIWVESTVGQARMAWGTRGHGNGVQRARRARRRRTPRSVTPADSHPCVAASTAIRTAVASSSSTRRTSGAASVARTPHARPDGFLSESSAARGADTARGIQGVMDIVT